jgi:hypothetical protein
LQFKQNQKLKVASLNDIRKSMKNLDPAEMEEIILRLAKFKVDNKALLNYLLYERADEENYIKDVKIEISQVFSDTNISSQYLAKKTIRKALKICNNHIKYSGLTSTSIELLLHFCSELKDLGFNLKGNHVLANLYQRQIKRIEQSINTLHEDLQYDYYKELEKLNT